MNKCSAASVMPMFNVATLDDEQSAMEPWTTGTGVGQINISIIFMSGNRSTINCEKDRSSSLVMNVWMVGIFVAMLPSRVAKSGERVFRIDGAEDCSDRRDGRQRRRVVSIHAPVSPYEFIASRTVTKRTTRVVKKSKHSRTEGLSASGLAERVVLRYPLEPTIGRPWPRDQLWNGR